MQLLFFFQNYNDPFSSGYKFFVFKVTFGLSKVFRNVTKPLTAAAFVSFWPSSPVLLHRKQVPLSSAPFLKFRSWGFIMFFEYIMQLLGSECLFLSIIFPHSRSLSAGMHRWVSLGPSDRALQR